MTKAYCFYGTTPMPGARLTAFSTMRQLEDFVHKYGMAAHQRYYELAGTLLTPDQGTNGFSLLVYSAKAIRQIKVTPRGNPRPVAVGRKVEPVTYRTHPRVKISIVRRP